MTRRTRGISRWWARCWRWAGRTKRPRNEPMPLTPELVITAQQMQQIGRAMTRAGDRPTPAEFAAAPPLTYSVVDRLIGDLLNPIDGPAK